jgi:hypothetical protein
MGIVDVNEINEREDYSFYIDGQFIKEKNDNSSTSMPLRLSDFNQYMNEVPCFDKPEHRRTWIHIWRMFKGNHYDWESAKRILTELTGFFKSCPALGVEVTKQGNKTLLRKVDEVVAIKDTKQTTITEAPL